MMHEKTNHAGFTLVELLVAIAISGIVFLMVFGVIRSAVDTQVYVREMSDAGRQGPAILQQVAADLENAYFYNVLENDIFIGKMVEIGGEMRADRIHFVTTRPSLLMDPDIEPENDDDEGHPALLSEVSWVLKESPNGDFYELHRREQPGFDEDFTRGGYYRMIMDRVISFKLQYTGWDLSGEDGSLLGSFDGESADASSGIGGIGGITGQPDEATSEVSDEEAATLEWEDEWNSLEKGGLPVAVKIEMIISPLIDPDVEDRIRKDQREDEFEYHYIHIVLLPQFREDIRNMQATYAWEGTVAEPIASGGVAGGAGGGRGTTTQSGPGQGQGGRNGEGGQGQGQNGQNQTTSPFMDIIRGGGSNRGSGGSGLGGILGGANKGR